MEKRKKGLKLPSKILSGEPRRISTEELRESSFNAAKEIADFLSSTLGPQSLHKMIVDSQKIDYRISSDGKTIMQRFDLMEFKAKHPVAVLFRELSKTQDYDIGDGTTSTIIIAAELLNNASKLIHLGIHPNIIAEGYKIAAKETLRLINELATDTTEEMLLKVIETAVDTKYEESKEIAKIIVDAIGIIKEDGKANSEDVQIVKKEGGRVISSLLFRGFIAEKGFLHEDMPKVVENAKIAVIDVPITVKSQEGLFSGGEKVPGFTVRVKSVEDLRLHSSQEKEYVWEMVEKIKRRGANVIISRKTIEERLWKRLAKEGIAAIHRIPTRKDLERLAKAVNAKIITDLEGMSEKELGFAERIEEKKYNDRSCLVFIKATNPKAATILIKGGVHHIVSDIARAVKDGLDAGTRAISKRILPGGGATEVEVAMKLRKSALRDKTKRQLAIFAFADSLEIIPKVLARNSGKDPLSFLLELRSEHHAGNKYSGYEAKERKIKNMLKEGIVEPLRVKEGIIKGAYDTSITILKSDDIVYGNVLEDRIREEELRKYEKKLRRA